MRLLMLRGRLAFSAMAWWLCLLADQSIAMPPANPGPGDVLLTIDVGQSRKPISPYIYGSNSALIVNRTFDRSGGNRMTGYNWETNASNAGSDYFHHSDYFLTNGQANLPPGSAVSGMLQSAASSGRAALVTIPMAGFVSADANGTVDESEIAPSARWKEVAPKKSTIYPGAPLSTVPNTTDGYVFNDEYVHWVESVRQSGQTVFYSLDNEPALWGESLPPGWQSGIPNVLAPSHEGRTHPTIHPYAVTFAEMRDKTIAHASAVKDVNPNATVFGGVGYGWLEAVNLQVAPDAVASPIHPGGDQPGELHYYEWLLQQVAAAESQQNRKLMDVIDLHWYPEAQGADNNGNLQRIVFSGNETHPGVVAARVQAPRSLWDSTYTETSWITGCCSGGPIKLLPHLQRDIDDFKPGTKIAITEYNYGAGDHISGGIAEADVLGIFGREGVFAANWWDLNNGSSFVNGAFEAFRNFDGQGGMFGDVSVHASTDDIGASSIYASIDSNDPSRLVLVAINRTGQALDAAIAITSDVVYDRAEVYQLTSASATPRHAADAPITLFNAFHYAMPAYSVSTLVLQGIHDSADFNHDGAVNGDDFAAWQAAYGVDAGADADQDGDSDGRDFLEWQRQFGSRPQFASANTSTPEPSTMLLAAALSLVRLGKRARQGRAQFGV